MNKRLELSPEDLAKVQRARARDNKIKISSTWLYLAEFGYYFGWQGVQAIRNNELTIEEADMLLVGARKIWRGHTYDNASAVFIGAGSANSKKPKQTFVKATRELLKSTKADK